MREREGKGQEELRGEIAGGRRVGHADEQNRDFAGVKSNFLFLFLFFLFF